MTTKKPKRKQRLTPRQKKLIQQIPVIESGENTKIQAKGEAGYAESSALQQTEVFGGLRNNARAQDALRKVGLTGACGFSVPANPSGRCRVPGRLPPRRKLRT